MAYHSSARYYKFPCPYQNFARRVNVTQSADNLFLGRSIVILELYLKKEILFYLFFLQESTPSSHRYVEHLFLQMQVSHAAKFNVDLVI